MKKCHSIIFFIGFLFIVCLISPGICSTDKLSFNSLADLESQVLTFIKDRDGFVWIGTYVDGLYRFDKKKQKFKTFGRENSWDLFEDDNGAIWLSTWGNGIGRWDCP